MLRQNKLELLVRSVKFFILVPLICRAVESPYDKEEAVIPNIPKPPPLLKQREPVDIPHCERFFLYKGKMLECDSNAARDAEQIRPYIMDVPAAVHELDLYQENLHRGRLLAYLGTASVVMIIAGTALGHPPIGPNGSISLGGYVLIGGFFLGVNTAIYSLSMQVANDRHIGRALEYYNAVHPDRPIELQFSTNLNF